MNDGFVRDKHALTIAGAQAIVAAAVEKAAALSVPQCIAVVDDGGHLLAFARMDGARIGSISIAQTKAVSAATRKRPTADEAGGDALTAIRLALAAERVTNLSGGIPLVVGGDVVGAVGVSSGTLDEDTQVARAGADALG